MPAASFDGASWELESKHILNLIHVRGSISFAADQNGRLQDESVNCYCIGHGQSEDDILWNFSACRGMAESLGYRLLEMGRSDV